MPTITKAAQAADTAAIESIREFALNHIPDYDRGEGDGNLAEFVQLCDAALNGEALAVERVNNTIDRLGARVRDCGPLTSDEFDGERLRAILATDTALASQ